MSQQIKITDSELDEIKMLQGKFQETIIKLGNLRAEVTVLNNAMVTFAATRN